MNRSAKKTFFPLERIDHRTRCERATYRYLEFFTANIRNKNMRAAYA